LSFKVTILGASGALPAYGRHPSAQLVEVESRFFMVDCGEGAQMQLMKFQANLHRINHIFVSHLHGDHYLGLMGLIFTMHLQRRTNDLHLYSHRGLDEIITMQLRYSRSSPSFKIIFHRLEKDVREIIFEDSLLTVETIPLFHKIRCSGFLFREKPKQRRIDKNTLPANLTVQQLGGLKAGNDVKDESGNILYRNADLTLPPKRSRSYAYCSDTAFHEPVIEQIKDVDLLYHEATFSLQDELRARDTLHSTAYHAATIAARSNVSKLIIGHFSGRYKDLNVLLEEAQKVYANTALAQEGETYNIAEN